MRIIHNYLHSTTNAEYLVDLNKKLQENIELNTALKQTFYMALGDPKRQMFVTLIFGILLGKKIAQTEILEDMLTGESEAG